MLPFSHATGTSGIFELMLGGPGSSTSHKKHLKRKTRKA